MSVKNDELPTAQEAVEALGPVCVSHAVAERVELVAGRRQWWCLRIIWRDIVRLQPRLDRVERILAQSAFTLGMLLNDPHVPQQMSKEDCSNSQQPRSGTSWSISSPARCARRPATPRSGPWGGWGSSGCWACRRHAAAYWLSLAVEDCNVSLRQSR